MKRLLNIALLLSVFTIAYNLIEGTVSIFFGIGHETLALFGFGADSFVEVISGLGIAHMIFRMKRKESTLGHRDRFERTALKITGTAFYLLTAGLLFGAAASIIQNQQPETTLAGIIISIISILTMYILYYYKVKVGKELNSDAVIADANCTKTCFYLSIILLISSGVYELWHIPYVDAAGSLGIAWFSFSEGRESWEKARTGDLMCNC